MGAFDGIWHFIHANFGILSTIVAIFAGAFWLKMDSQYAKKTEVRELKFLSKEHEGRISNLEAHMENLPTAVDVEKLKTMVADIKGDTKVTSKQVDSINHQLGLLIEAKLKD